MKKLDANQLLSKKTCVSNSPKITEVLLNDEVNFKNTYLVI